MILPASRAPALLLHILGLRRDGISLANMTTLEEYREQEIVMFEPRFTRLPTHS